MLRHPSVSAAGGLVVVLRMIMFAEPNRMKITPSKPIPTGKVGKLPRIMSGAPSNAYYTRDEAHKLTAPPPPS